MYIGCSVAQSLEDFLLVDDSLPGLENEEHVYIRCMMRLFGFINMDELENKNTIHRMRREW